MRFRSIRSGIMPVATWFIKQAPMDAVVVVCCDTVAVYN